MEHGFFSDLWNNPKKLLWGVPIVGGLVGLYYWLSSDSSIGSVCDTKSSKYSAAACLEARREKREKAGISEYDYQASLTPLLAGSGLLAAVGLATLGSRAIAKTSSPVCSESDKSPPVSPGSDDAASPVSSSVSSLPVLSSPPAVTPPPDSASVTTSRNLNITIAVIFITVCLLAIAYYQCSRRRNRDDDDHDDLNEPVVDIENPAVPPGVRQGFQKILKEGRPNKKNPYDPADQEFEFNRIDTDLQAGNAQEFVEEVKSYPLCPALRFANRVKLGERPGLMRQRISSISDRLG